MRNFIIILLLALYSPLFLYSHGKYEIRAVWLTTLGGIDWPKHKAYDSFSIEKQKKELCNILDSLKEANFNTVLLQTRVRGDVIYPSSVETFAECLTGHTGMNPGYDPLLFAIAECHKRGMELHAWIVTIPIGNIRQVKLLGRKSIVNTQKKICKLYDGSWYLDPGCPETKDYLVRIVDEIVRRYDVDGIHLDYIRYPERANSFPDKNTYKKYGKGKSLKQWRRDNITSIVKAIYQNIKKQKPWVKLSSSPVGKYNDTGRFSSRGWNAYDVVYQDAQKWLRDGIHDILFPMMYFNGNNFYPFALDWMENNYGRWIVPGLGIYFLSPSEKDWPLDEVARQISFIRQYKLNGEAFFRTKFLLDDTKKIMSELKDNFYNTQALIPPMIWQCAKKPEAPCQGSINIVNDIIKMSWQQSGADNSSMLRYNIYGSNNYPVDINDGDNIIASYISEMSYNYSLSFPWKTKLYFVVTAIDRYGNESEPLALNEPISF